MSVRVGEVVGEVKGDSSVAVSIKGGLDVVSRDAFVALGMGRNGRYHGDKKRQQECC